MKYTAETLPDEFEFKSACGKVFCAVYQEVHCGYRMYQYWEKDDPSWSAYAYAEYFVLKQDAGHITFIEKEKEQMKDNVSNKIPELKPFMRLVCRNGEVFIYATEEDGRCVGVFAEGRQSWDKSLTETWGIVEYDVIEVYAAPERIGDYLDFNVKGPLLWKRETEEQLVAKEVLEQAHEMLSLAIAAHLEAYKQVETTSHNRHDYLKKFKKALEAAKSLGVDVSAYE